MKKRYVHNSLNEAENTLSHILEIIQEGVWDWNALSGHVERSPGWYSMLGYDVDCFNKDVLTWENVIHPEDYSRVMQHFEDYLNGKNSHYCIQYRCKCADGGYLWIEDVAKIIERTPEGKVARMIGAHQNIHAAKTAKDELNRQNELLRNDNATLENLIRERTLELHQLNIALQQQLEQIGHIANHDKLTAVYNRHMFEEVFRKEISRAKRYDRPLSLVMVDVDYFKEINDRYGHQNGDAVLRDLAATLQKNLRDSDIIARWGGEEFIIILPNTPFEQAVIIAEDLRATIAEHRFDEGIHLTCSFGVTAYRQEDTTDTIFARIDKALYRAKEFERNNVQAM
ncbi:sensor domain-containing diguanylate cyclase [Sulfurimonas sp. HSL3-7]|uniref:sensor domain-containing diguanylate cyclase n=1 Tax=Sulfonitrofixus jiaomeiensis TaxID=3131938 RepID=UPI0031F98980